MDYRKLDAALAAALGGEAADDTRADIGEDIGEDIGLRDGRLSGLPGQERKLSVFVHVDPKEPAPDDRDELARLGLSPRSLQGGIGTATLSPSQVAELSEQPWVRSIRLSTPLRLLHED